MINSHCPTQILLMRSVISGNRSKSVKPTLNNWSQLLPRRQLPYNQHNIHILNIITLWNFPILADLDKSYWMVGWMTTMIYIIAIFGGWEKKLLPNSNGDIKKYFSPATHWKKLLNSQICWKKYLSSIENTRPPPESQLVAPLLLYVNKIYIMYIRAYTLKYEHILLSNIEFWCFYPYTAI